MKDLLFFRMRNNNLNYREASKIQKFVCIGNLLKFGNKFATHFVSTECVKKVFLFCISAS